MSIPIVVVSDNGLQPAPYRANSLSEPALVEPPGVYTVTRTYAGGRVVLLDAHLDRLEESARLMGIATAFERTWIREGLSRLVEESERGPVRVRVTVPRSNPSQAILALEPWTGVPAALKEQGVKAATSQLGRDNPRAKGNAWVHKRLEALRTLPEDVYEGLLADEAGRILEGFTSNFFAVRGHRLFTASEGVLLGIARHVLLASKPADLRLVERPVRRAELSSLEECFLTSSSRGVIAIVEIDGQRIGTGGPGETTRDLSRRHDEWVATHLERI